MQHRYKYEQIKKRMLSYGKVMLSSDDDVTALRQHIYALRKNGFVINRIGDRGNIKGYQLIEAPEELVK